MRSEYDYITVNKVLPQGEGLICLLSYEVEGDPFRSLSVIKKVILSEHTSQEETLYITSMTLTDITVSSTGCIWAVDILGYLHTNQADFGDRQIYIEGRVNGAASVWSCRKVVQGASVCVIGEDNNLWIATHEGELVNFDGRNIKSYKGMENPIRFKEVNGHYFLMGYNRQLMQYQKTHWQMLAFDDSTAMNIPINDLTSVKGRLVAVSNFGFILTEQADKQFTVMLRTPGTSWFGCDVLHETVYLAGGKKGAYQLVGDTLELINTEGFMVATKVVGKGVIFLLASTLSAGIMHYTALGEQRWTLVKL